MFTQMQGGLTIGLTLSAVVFVLAMLSEGRAHKALSWVLNKTGQRSTDMSVPTSATFVERDQAPVARTSSPLPRREESGSAAFRAPRHRVNVEAAPALAHHDTREPEFSTHA